MAEHSSSQQPKHFPKDGQVIVSMMKDLGITSYEPRVVNQLLEFTVRYVSSVLDDARAFATHSKKKAIDNDDVRLAVMMQLERVFTTPPPRDLLLEVARTKNSLPLPLVKPHCGIRLPPDRYCFSQCNFRLKSSAVSKKPDLKGKFGLGSQGGGTSIKVSKPTVVVSSSSSTVGIKRPPNVTAVAKPQATLSQVNNPKPTIKFTTNQMMVSTSLSGSAGTSSGGMMVSKPRIITAGSSGVQQVEVKIEPQDSLLGKRKREDESE